MQCQEFAVRRKGGGKGQEVVVALPQFLTGLHVPEPAPLDEVPVLDEQGFAVWGEEGPADALRFAGAKMVPHLARGRFLEMHAVLADPHQEGAAGREDYVNDVP